MEAKSTDRKTFLLTENGQQLGELIYENQLFLTAEIGLTNSERYQIKPVGFFGTSISVTKNDREIASLVMNWSGQIVISYQDGEEYLLKLNNFFHGKYIMENKNKEPFIQLDPKFNWRAFQYNYDISYNISGDHPSKDTLLLLLGVYAANYFIACMSGSHAGMM